MSTCKLMPHSTTGELITVSKNNPQYGTIKLVQKSKSSISGTFMQTKADRVKFVNGEVATLQEFIAELGTKREIEGNITIAEYVESEVPAHVAKKFFNSKLPYEEAIKNYVKKAGAEPDAPEVTLGGERILRFVDFDDTCEIKDIKVQHDNVEALSAWRAAVKAAAQATVQTAKLPK